MGSSGSGYCGLVRFPELGLGVGDLPPGHRVGKWQVPDSKPSDEL